MGPTDTPVRGSTVELKRTSTGRLQGPTARRSMRGARCVDMWRESYLEKVKDGL